MRHGWILATLILLVHAVSPAFGQSHPTTTAPTPTTQRYTPTVGVHPTTTPPIIDGRLDDPAWRDAVVIDNFQQISPIEGGVPSERTELRVTYDADNLYVGVYCYDSAGAAGVLAKQRARDGDVAGDDVFTITIDPYNDQRNGYWFEFSPAGAKRDATVENGSVVRIEWDGIWYLATRVGSDGWFAEVAIPIKTISFNPDTDTWGFNVGRTIRRKQETIRWAGISRASAVRNVGNAGRINGIGGLQQGLGLTVRPFVTGSYELDDNDINIKPGFDVFYKITPGITAALTVNTDFAEADVDTRRVNLTRFPLFFPEKRAFFLQDAGIFSFGGVSQSPLPFFSRRIGIVNGEQKDILAGLKLTGRQGRANFGVLDVQMYPDEQLGDKNLSVVRATYDVLEQSSVGIIATHGDPSSPGDNGLVGTDFNYRRDAADGRIYEGHAWAQAAYNDPDFDDAPPGAAGTDAAYGLNVSYPNDEWSCSAGWSQVGPNFRPAMGFVQRKGVNNYNAYVRRRWNNVAGLRAINVSTSGDLYTTLDQELQSAGVNLPEVSFETARGDVLSVGSSYSREKFDVDFDIAHEVTIPAGDYPFVRGYAQLSSSDARPIAVTTKFAGGQFYDGTREDYLATLEFRPNASIFGTLEGEWNDVHLPDGDFLVRILRTRLNVLFSPELSWNNSVQYDNLSESGSFNSRVRWEFKPGQELFLVANRGFNIDDGIWKATDTQLTVKCGLTLRF